MPFHLLHLSLIVMKLRFVNFLLNKYWICLDWMTDIEETDLTSVKPVSDIDGSFIYNICKKKLTSLKLIVRTM